MRKLYYMKDVVKITGINQPKLQQWLRDGFIEPKIKGEGSGTRNQFSFGNLCEIKLFQRLVENGVSRSAAAKQLNAMLNFSHFEKYEKLPGFVITYTDLKKKIIGTRQIGVFNDLDELEAIKEGASEYIQKGFDVITLYSLKRIVEDIKEGIVKTVNT